MMNPEKPLRDDLVDLGQDILQSDDVHYKTTADDHLSKITDDQPRKSRIWSPACVTKPKKINTFMLVVFAITFCLIGFFIILVYQLRHSTIYTTSEAENGTITSSNTTLTDSWETSTNETQNNCDEHCQWRKAEIIHALIGNESYAAKIIKSMDLEVNPCVDFYSYSCGNWAKEHPIPNGHYLWGPFFYLQTVKKDILHGELMQYNSNDDNETLIVKSVYRSCIDDGLKSILNESKLQSEILLKSLSTRNYTESGFSDDESFTLNVTELQNKISKQNGNFPFDKDVTEGFWVRDNCIENLDNELILTWLLEQFYIRSIPLDDSKATQVTTIMENVKEQVLHLLENKKTQWFNEDDNKRNKTLQQTLKLIKETKTCIGYFKELLDENSTVVEQLYNEYSRLLTDIGNSTTEAEIVNLDAIDFNYTPTCYWVNGIPGGAYYMSAWNSIEIDYSFLQPPFYDSFLPNAMNYGGMGFIIGHEFSHAIPVKTYQRNKKLGPVLSCLEKQYNTSCEITIDAPNLNKRTIQIDGSQTFLENFADNVGIKAAYAAYKALSSVNDQTEDSDNDRLFFLAFAQAMCSSASPYLQTDEELLHAPDELRILTALQNSEEFANAYKCPIGSAMNPVQKCHLF